MSPTQTLDSITDAIALQVSDCAPCGVTELRRIRRTVSKDLRMAAPHQVRDIIMRLLAIPHVPRWFTYELVNQDARVMEILTRRDVDRMGFGMAAWGDVDSFACLVSGPAWRNGAIVERARR